MGKLNWSMKACGVFLLWAVAAIVLPGQTAPGVLSAPARTIAPAVMFTLLHSFDITDGQSPYAGLVQGTDGNFYGTTELGGADDKGTVFKITPSGTLTMLHNFDGTNGAVPYAGLVQATDGNFYGTTYTGGADDYGTVFKITPRGKLTTLHSST